MNRVNNYTELKENVSINLKLKLVFSLTFNIVVFSTLWAHFSILNDSMEPLFG